MPKRNPIQVAAKLYSEGFRAKGMWDVCARFERDGMRVEIEHPDADTNVAKLMMNLDKNGKV